MQIKRPHSSSSLFPLQLTPMDVQYLLLHSPAYWFTDLQTKVNKIIPSSSTESDTGWLRQQTLRHVSRLLGSQRDTVNWVSLLTSIKPLFPRLISQVSTIWCLEVLYMKISCANTSKTATIARRSNKIEVVRRSLFTFCRAGAALPRAAQWTRPPGSKHSPKTQISHH